MKNSHFKWIVLGCSAVIFLQCRAQRPNPMPGKPAVLNIINNFAEYETAVTKDSLQAMVNLQNWLSPMITDWKYASTDNFTHTILYHQPKALVRLPVARALQRVQQELTKQGLSLKFYDAYRPYSITKKMWQLVPDERYAANPARGSAHNKGAAVDVSLVNLQTGQELSMPTSFDNFTEKAHQGYQQLPPVVIQNRDKRKKIMEKYGFTALATEWWHYTWSVATGQFPVLDLDFALFK